LKEKEINQKEGQKEEKMEVQEKLDMEAFSIIKRLYH